MSVLFLLVFQETNSNKEHVVIIVILQFYHDVAKNNLGS